MKKFLLFFVAMSVLNFTNAQESSTITTTKQDGEHTVTTTYDASSLVRTNRFANNWALSFSVGPQFYIGEYDYYADFIDWWTFPSFDLTLTKWASPVFGVGFGLTYSRYTGLSAVGDKSTTFYDADDPLYTTGSHGVYQQNTGSYMSMNFYGSLNLTNLFGGDYVDVRPYYLEVFFGGGLLFAFTDVTQLGAAFQLGLRNQWMIGDRWSIDATLRGSLIADEFDGKSWLNNDQRNGVNSDNFPLDGVFGAMIGVTYRFGFDKNDPNAYSWKPMTTVIEEIKKENQCEQLEQDLTRTTETLDKVAAAACGAGVDVERLTGDKELAERACANAPKYVDYIIQKPAPAPQIVRTPTKFWIPVQFMIDKWNITRYEEVSIIAAADVIKDLPEGVKVKVAGYADIQTASASYNKELSERRANAVANMLVDKYGVDRDRLVVVAQGGVENMFLNDNKLSRCVIISLAD